MKEVSTYTDNMQGMEHLIKQAFLHVDLLGPHVQEGHYDLIGPDGEIILPQVWDTMIKPDYAIEMQMWPIPELDPKHKMPHPMPGGLLGGGGGGGPGGGLPSIDDLIKGLSGSKNKGKGAAGHGKKASGHGKIPPPPSFIPPPPGGQIPGMPGAGVIPPPHGGPGGVLGGMPPLGANPAALAALMQKADGEAKKGAGGSSKKKSKEPPLFARWVAGGSSGKKRG
jgi:hypothetical protein